MKISHDSYLKYINKIAIELEGKTLFSPILLNNETLLFPMMENFNKSLVVSLNNKSPLVYLIKNDNFYASFENGFLLKFRKLFNRTIITNLSLSKTDNILTFYLESIETGYKRKFIVELFQNTPNLIITNDEKIDETFFKNKNRNLNFGDTYLPPVNSSILTENIEISEEFLTQHFNNELENKFKEKYGPFLKFLDTRIKSIKKKISSINNDVKLAEENLKYTGIADEIYSLGINLKDRVSALEVDGEIIQLNPTKTISENCQLFYKKSKRAKETINHSKLNIANAEDSLKEIEEVRDKFNNSNEKEKDQLMLAYFPVNKKKETQQTILNRPWKYNLNGTYIYFGKNASQNDYLSFVLKTDREFTWLHIKNISGSHLIICSRKPTENELLFACEFALICSHQKTGEIIYTKKKNVCRGHTLGEAIVKNQQTIKLNTVRKETIEAFAQAKRFD